MGIRGRSCLIGRLGRVEVGVLGFMWEYDVVLFRTALDIRNLRRIRKNSLKAFSCQCL
jgi:hypothetical protein